MIKDFYGKDLKVESKIYVQGVIIQEIKNGKALIRITLPDSNKPTTTEFTCSASYCITNSVDIDKL